jgi:hypothetical protein
MDWDLSERLSVGEHDGISDWLALWILNSSGSRVFVKSIAEVPVASTVAFERSV